MGGDSHVPSRGNVYSLRGGSKVSVFYKVSLCIRAVFFPSIPARFINNLNFGKAAKFYRKLLLRKLQILK